LRLDKSQSLLELALMMEGSHQGVSLADISERFRVGRRTAERMRDAIARLFPMIEELRSGEGIKRWRLPGHRATGLISFTVEELAALDTAKRVLTRKSMRGHADALTRVQTKVLSLLRPNSRTRTQVDLEALTEAEGLAARPGPRPAIPTAVIEPLREAILRCHRVRLHYRSRETGRLSRQTVCPYGFLYGSRHYLVAFSLNPQALDYRLFSLANIDRVEPTEMPFERRSDFSLQEYADRSFGVFQGQVYDVVLRFSEHAAPDARTFMFHPSQQIEDQADGTLVVNFKASSLREMTWHLFTWGAAVQVIEPAALCKLWAPILRALRTSPIWRRELGLSKETILSTEPQLSHRSQRVV